MRQWQMLRLVPRSPSKIDTASLVHALALDKAVDLCYRPQAFANERVRIEYLFDLYQQYTKPLLPMNKEKKK